MIKYFLTIITLLALPLSSMASTVVRLETNKGNIEITLANKEAPKTVANFLHYVSSGFYSNTIFHRVIKGFMIQGGGFTTTLTEKPTLSPIANEANNGLKNTIGTIAMARTSYPNSATAQFFINVANNDFLNYSSPTPQGWGYAVFGRVTKGIEVVEKIADQKTGMANGMADVPTNAIIIKKASVIKQ